MAPVPKTAAPPASKHPDSPGGGCRFPVASQNAAMTSFDCSAATSQLLVIDIQERFQKPIPAIAADGDCARACGILIDGCRLLEVPTTVTEQYPQGLGATVPHLAERLAAATCLAKTHFSCADDPLVREHLAAQNRPNIVVCGIEAHVCVLATVDDLQRRGWQVLVAADAIASRHPEKVAPAIASMRQLGALVLPVESILFRLQRQSGVGCFKELSRLVR